MMGELPPEARCRLVKLAGMLGSGFPGERANAAERATELLRRHGSTWADALQPSPPIQEPPREIEIVCPECGESSGLADCDWRTVIRLALQNETMLTEWEVEFCRSLRGRARLTTRQEEIVDRLRSKLGVWL